MVVHAHGRIHKENGGETMDTVLREDAARFKFELPFIWEIQLSQNKSTDREPPESKPWSNSQFFNREMGD